MKITVVVVLLLAFTCYFLLPVLVPKVEAHGSCQSLRAEWARKLADSVSNLLQVSYPESKVRVRL